MVEDETGALTERPSDAGIQDTASVRGKRPAFFSCVRFAVLGSGTLTFAGGCLIAIELARGGLWIAAVGTVAIVLAGILLLSVALLAARRSLSNEQRDTRRWRKVMRSQERHASRLGDEFHASATEIRQQARALTDVVLYKDLDRTRIDARGLPLVMISQVQRSGGTLLSQLFDGHRQLLAFPQELKWGETVKCAWPTVEPSHGMQDVMNRLIKGNLQSIIQSNATGYVKQQRAPGEYGITHRWSYWQFVDSFMEEWERQPPVDRRGCLDIYFSAYFSAFGGLRHGGCEKSAITAFTPRFSLVETMPGNVAFFSDYPDGLLICLCRRPVDWYASASRHSAKFADPDTALNSWLESARCGIALSKQFPGQVKLLTFEALIQDPRTAMTRLAQSLDVPFEESMLAPTFNGHPVPSNSSFDSAEGIQRAVLDRANHIPPDLQERIRLECMPLYLEFSERAESI